MWMEQAWVKRKLCHIFSFLDESNLFFLNKTDKSSKPFHFIPSNPNDCQEKRLMNKETISFCELSFSIYTYSVYDLLVVEKNVGNPDIRG